MIARHALYPTSAAILAFLAIPAAATDLANGQRIFEAV